MELKTIFKNQFDELRAGWQIALFVLAFAAISAAIVMPLTTFAGVKDAFALSAAMLVASLVASLLITKFMNRKTLAAVGLTLNKQGLRELGLGCLIGWLMMTGIFGIEYLLDYVKVVEAEVTLAQGIQTFFLSAAFFAVAAMFEEVLFRGYIFQTLARGVTVVPAMVIMAVLFGLAHLGNPNASAFGVLNTALVSMVFCLAYLRTRGLWLPFGIHFAWNFAQTTLYGFRTSGANFSTYELTRLTQFGPDWITGGAYGPEGGALATLAVVLCGIYLYLFPSLSASDDIATLERPGEDIGVQFLLKNNHAEKGRLAA